MDHLRRQRVATTLEPQTSHGGGRAVELRPALVVALAKHPWVAAYLTAHPDLARRGPEALLHDLDQRHELPVDIAIALEPAPAPGFCHKHPWMRRAEAEAHAAADRALDEVPPTASSSVATAPAPAPPRRDGGDPLPAELRARFETAFGRDLANVRVHRDDDAQREAERLGFRAFAQGADIVLGRGVDPAASTFGRQVLAHEAAHVVQQGGGGIGLGATPAGAVQGWCDPTTATCPPEGACVDPATAPRLPRPEVPTPTAVSCTMRVAAPPVIGGRREEPAVEEIVLPMPILGEERHVLYAVPVEYVFETAEEARNPRCRPGQGPVDPPPESQPRAPDPLPLPPGGGPLALPAPPRSAPPAFAAGRTVYTLDGPITIVSATASYVVTDVYTAYAVGAGATALARTASGNVLVDGGMHQVGGQINDVLADAIMTRLEASVGDAGIAEVMITHIHADHTKLLPRIYARWAIGTLRVNALQALLPAAGGGTRLESLVEDMIEARRAGVEREVRTELTGTFGPWSLYVDAEAAEARQAFDDEVRRQVASRLAGMQPTSVQLAIPSGGQVVAANMPIGNIALPPGMRPDASPITRGLQQPGLVTLLDPGARPGAATSTPPPAPTR